MPVFTCDLGDEGAPFPHFWEHSVGSGRALLALRADWQRQLDRCRREVGFRHVRFHGLLSDELGTLVRQGEERIYSFFNADQIMDFLLSIDMRPFVELSFMPSALASGDRTVFKYRGNVTPPRDDGEWATLVGRLAGHWLDRYGREEVRRWPFEVWNEPNLESFWTGTRHDYFRLYRRTAEALKAADPSLPVGGPATAQDAWIPEFLEFCERSGVPADFVTTHHYATDGLGSPEDDAETQLARGSRGLLRERALKAHVQARGRPLYYTEWNSSSSQRDPLHDRPFAAAFVVKTVMDMEGLVAGYSFWTFSDIFEESYFPSVPFHGGFGLLTLHGVPKPAYRAFELLHRLGDRRLPVRGSHPTVDAWAVRDEENLTLLLANHALPRQAVETERVELRLRNLAPPRSVWLERIDDGHAAARSLWEEMGGPEYLSPWQVEALQSASRLVKEPLAARADGDAFVLDVELPPHGVAAITLELSAEARSR